MIAHPPFGSPSFKEVAKGLVSLHRLIQAGQDDSPAAEAVRDALDAPLAALSEAEKQQAQWLSEDLFSVSEPAPVTNQQEMTSQVQEQVSDAMMARQIGEWGRALMLLRSCNEVITPDLLSYLRGAIWLEAGHFDVAAMFFGHASKLDPANANYQALYVHALAESRSEARTPADDGGLE